MADKSITFLPTQEGYVPLRAKDNGDGSWSLAVVALGASGAVTTRAEDTAHTTGDLLTPVGVIRKDVLASIAGADGDYTLLQVTDLGALRVNLPGSDHTNLLQRTEAKYLYKYLEADGAVKVGPGVLHSVTVSASAAAVITLYDGLDASVSAEKFATLRVASDSSECFIYDVSFSNLWCEVVSGIAEITVAYR